MANRNCWRRPCSSPHPSPTALTDTWPATAARSRPWAYCSIPWPTSSSSPPRSSPWCSSIPAWFRPGSRCVIIAREFLVSGLRSIAASEGFTIEASDLGKFKMLVQIVSVVAVILDHRWKEWPVRPLHFPGALDRGGRHLVHGLFVAGVGARLLCRVLVEDRPPGGQEPPPRLRPQPAEETRCARHLMTLPLT